MGQNRSLVAGGSDLLSINLLVLFLHTTGEYRTGLPVSLILSGDSCALKAKV